MSANWAQDHCYLYSYTHIRTIRMEWKQNYFYFTFNNVLIGSILSFHQSKNQARFYTLVHLW